MNREDLLHERLARLQAGEPLETCSADLPNDEANLLGLVAALRAVPYPDETANAIAAQRARLRHAARENKNMASSPSQIIANAIAQVRSRRMSLAAFPRPLALLLVGAIILSALVGIIGTRPIFPGTNVSQAPGDAQGPAPLSTGLPYQVHIPLISNPLVAPNPQTGVLSAARGVVEIQTSDGVWKEANVGQAITIGQRVRTGQLSSAALLFYDGSQAHVGPAAEVSVDELDARTDGPRVVQLTQWIGESDHDVTPSSNTASRYEVRTPSGSGAAKGTKFRVLVTANLIARFNVDEGSVAVTSLNVTVVVVAGQSTTIYANQAPTQPVFRVNGEGRLEQTGDVWRIGGRDFLVNTSVGTDRSTTEIVGNPQIGDWVAVEGRILPDGRYFADRIVLLHRAQEDRFAFTGTVDTLGDTQWTISGRAVRVNAETDIDAGLKAGDVVEVRGAILQDGTLLAERIRLVDEAGLPFEFTGIVESIGADAWSVSGVSVTVNANTRIETGIVVGDIVKVRGRILADGVWLARDIKRAEGHEREFEFTGVVESVGTWVVGGIGFETDAQTQIDADIQVGDRVRVKGRVLQDGIWLAEAIRLLDDERQRFEFVGRVTSTNPWVVGGISFETDAQTQIDTGIQIGDRVRVSGRILDDGSRLAEQIRRLDQNEPQRFEFVGRVTSINPWVVGGISFETDAQTQLDTGIQIGDRVRVSGRILDDGTLLAERIRKLDARARRFEFVGRVTSINPWVVGGISLAVDANTVIESGIVAGDTVRVRGRILPDGTLLAERITRVHRDRGCLDVRAVVAGIGGNQIRLRNGQVVGLTDQIEVRGDLKPFSVVIIGICTSEDDTVVVVNIIVIFQLQPPPSPPQPPPPPQGGGDGDDDDDDDDD